MSKHAKHHKHPTKKRAVGTAGVKARPAHFILFIVVLVAVSILIILICSGTWTPW